MLVTVIMTTYNDEKYIVKTLESVKAQTYREIELIISDDKSTDNTVAVAREWVSRNKARFVDVKIIAPEINTGVTANCIRAVKASSGEWVKCVGGDNLITCDCIGRFVEYVNENVEAELVQCEIGFVNERGDVLCDKERELDEFFFDDVRSSEEQLRLFARRYYISALCLFCKRSLLYSMECFDTEFRDQEDTAFAFRVLQAGHKVWGLNERLIYKRLRCDSLSQQTTDKIVSSNDLITSMVRRKYIYKELDWIEKLFINITYNIQRIYLRSDHNHKHGVIFFLWRIIMHPGRIYNKLKLKYLIKELSK